MNPQIRELILTIPAFLLALTIHEYAHGWMALKKGDSTAFGWAKPVPPLDGSRILTSLLPLRQAVVYMRLERYGFLIMFILLWTGIIGKIVFPIINIITYLLLGYS